MNEIYDFLAEIDSLDETGQKELELLINKTSDLKQLPLIARKIMQVIENPKSTAYDLERVIQSDQSLTAKLLKISNSSFYGLLRKVNTLQRAILVVGFKTIKDIAVSTAILSMYRSSDPHSIKLWEQAIGVGIACRILSLEFQDTDTDEAFVAGLLHNLGKTLMLRADGDAVKSIYDRQQKDPAANELELEKEAFHFAYTHAGGTLIRNWNLAPSLEAAVRYHSHLPEVLWTDIDMDIKVTIAIVSYAKRLCRQLGIGWNAADPSVDLVNCPEIEFMKISPERILEIADEVKLAFFEENQLFA